jgi:hypothetical protein
MALDIDNFEANIENLDDGDDNEFDVVVVVPELDIDIVANNPRNDFVDIGQNIRLVVDAGSTIEADVGNRFDNGHLTIWTLWPMAEHSHLIFPYPLCWEILNLCLRNFLTNSNEEIFPS